MGDVYINDLPTLPDSTVLDGSELLLISDGGTSYRTTLEQMKTLLNPTPDEENFDAPLAQTSGNLVHYTRGRGCIVSMPRSVLSINTQNINNYVNFVTIMYPGQAYSTYLGTGDSPNGLPSDTLTMALDYNTKMRAWSGPNYTGDVLGDWYGAYVLWDSSLPSSMEPYLYQTGINRWSDMGPGTSYPDEYAGPDTTSNTWAPMMDRRLRLGWSLSSIGSYKIRKIQA